MFVFILCAIFFASCHNSEEEFKKLEVYKFSKVYRLPDSLEKSDSSLSKLEKDVLKNILKQQEKNFFLDKNDDIYLIKDTIQNDLMLQFWVLSEQVADSIDTNSSFLR